jgi:RimJ/RimL family protein N-acetyltransferase
MLTLKNDPETRKYAIASHDEIKREDHVKWLEKNIQYFQVIEETNKPLMIGAIRVHDNEVSVWIATKYRGCGFATSAINRVKKHGVTAKIVIENIPSMRAFIKSGFMPIKLTDNYYTFLYRAEIWAK